MKTETKKMIKPRTIQSTREIGNSSYVLRFQRNGMQFKPGQHIIVGIPGCDEAREYSIYSGINDDYLEILVREVENGKLSKKLHQLKPGDALTVEGPYGFFMYNTQPPGMKKMVFIASGTGIAPFHSFARSFPNAGYQIIHGVGTEQEASGKKRFQKEKYISCTTRDDKGDFKGRVTDYLRQADFDEGVLFYLCGNSEMIKDSMDILMEKGFSMSQMFTEVYY